MVVHSFTSDKTYDVTPESCTCPAKYYYPGKQCKHQTALIHEINRATIFGLLKMKFDCRDNGDEQTRRCYYELAIGA